MSTENVITIIICLLTAYITARVTVYHYRQEFLKKHSKEDTNKAVELAQYYATNIMPQINFVTTVYKNVFPQHLRTKINDARSKGELKFTSSEYKELFTEEEISAINNALDLNKLPINLLLEARALVHTTYLDDALFLESEAPKQRFGDKFEEYMQKQLAYEFKYHKRTLLNAFEFFSMYFNTKLAKEDQVYQSLHQTFLATMTYLYCDISILNVDPKDKFYTNAITLFNAWNKKFNDKTTRQAKSEDELIERTQSY